MSANTDAPSPIKVYTTEKGHAVIEQSERSIMISAEQILTVIRQLHVCYDYCAAWRESTQAPDRSVTPEVQS